MATKENAVLTMGLGSLETVLLAMNDVPLSARKAFRSRLAHLQRGGFPPAAAVGRHVRARYGLDELLQLAVLFALVQTYMPPVVARRVALEFWPEIARLFLASADNLGLGGAGRVPPDAPLYMTVLPSALRDMGTDDRGHGKGGVDQGGFEIDVHRKVREPAAVLIRSEDRPSENAVGVGCQLEPAATILIDFQLLTARLVDGLGLERRGDLEASTRDLACRFGW